MKRSQEEKTAESSEPNKKVKQTPHSFLVGKWMPKDHEHVHNWMTKLQERVDKTDRKLLPVIQDFKNLIEGDAELFMLFTLMFDEVPKRFKENPAHHHQVRSYQHMLKLVNHIMTEAPEYDETGVVGCPITAIFVYSMGTTAGFAAFLSPKVNRQLKIVLNEWAIFLASPDSRYVLTTKANGWFSESGLKHMQGDSDPRKFEEIFVCDPKAEYHGFSSWDKFFTRAFVDGIRPIAEPTNDNVIVNACESSPYRVVRDVKRCEEFWIKGQPYSLQHMLAGDENVDKFVGGKYRVSSLPICTKLSPRPVSGTIVKTYVIDGTYYSETLSVGWDESANNASEGYISAVATRGLIFIQSDNTEIGMVCFMAIGMTEVSTCEIGVYEGQHVNKGDQIGMFHFGGSSYCMIFQPEVELAFDLHGVPEGLDDMRNIDINAHIATVIPKVPAKKESTKKSVKK